MKRIIALAWKRPADENIPLSSKNSVANNGAIPKSDLKTDDKAPQEKMADSKTDSVDSSEPESKPMSLPRKLAMFLSMNIIALYFLAFAWLIPCRLLTCDLVKEWTVGFNNIRITTNIEVSDVPDSSLLLFGYVGDNSSANVIAVSPSAGSVKWRTPLSFRPLYCYCNSIDINLDGVRDCLIFGGTQILALNASNGHRFWQQAFGPISFRVATVRGCGHFGSQWIIIAEKQIVSNSTFLAGDRKETVNMAVVDSRNGTLVKRFPLRCDSFPRQMVTWDTRASSTHIALQCSYDDTKEVQIITETDLCDMVFSKSVSSTRGFQQLFSLGSSTAVEDVLLAPASRAGLMVGWSTMVAMATDARNPPRLLWQATSGSIRSVIKFLLPGHFTSGNTTQIAAVIQDGTSASVHVIDVSTGHETGTVELGSVPTSLLVARGKENMDSLLITKEEEISSNKTSYDGDVSDSGNSSSVNVSSAPQVVKSYELLTFRNGMRTSKLLTVDKRTHVTVKSGPCTIVYVAAEESNQVKLASRIFRGLGSNSSCYCR